MKVDDKEPFQGLQAQQKRAASDVLESFSESAFLLSINQKI